MNKVLALIVFVLFYMCPSAGFGQFSLIGELKDISEFCDILEEAQSKSVLIDSLVGAIHKSISKYGAEVTLVIGTGGNMGKTDARIRLPDGNPKGAVSFLSLNRNAYFINLDWLRALPTFVVRSNGSYGPSTGPAWAITRETLIAHELEELMDVIRQGYDYENLNHPQALKLENAIRREFGQSYERNNDWQGSCDGKLGRIIEIGPHKEFWVYKSNGKFEPTYIPSGSTVVCRKR